MKGGYFMAGAKKTKAQIEAERRARASQDLREGKSKGGKAMQKLQ